MIASFAVIIGQSYTAVLMVNPDYFKVYDREWVSIVILELLPPTSPSSDGPPSPTAPFSTWSLSLAGHPGRPHRGRVLPYHLPQRDRIRSFQAPDAIPGHLHDHRRFAVRS